MFCIINRDLLLCRCYVLLPAPIEKSRKMALTSAAWVIPDWDGAVWTVRKQWIWRDQGLRRCVIISQEIGKEKASENYVPRQNLHHIEILLYIYFLYFVYYAEMYFRKCANECKWDCFLIMLFCLVKFKYLYNDIWSVQ